jgi:hypothetical protein
MPSTYPRYTGHATENLRPPNLDPFFIRGRSSPTGKVTDNKVNAFIMKSRSLLRQGQVVT